MTISIINEYCILKLWCPYTVISLNINSIIMWPLTPANLIGKIPKSMKLLFYSKCQYCIFQFYYHLVNMIPQNVQQI